VPLLLLNTPGVEGDRSDVLNDDEIAYAIACAPNEPLAESASASSAEAFCQCLTISAHSLRKTVRFAKPCLPAPAWKPLESAVPYVALQLGLKKTGVNTVSPGLIET